MDFKDWLIAILLIGCLIAGWQARHYYSKSLNPVVVYDTDSLEIYKNKIKNEYIAKNIYVQEISQLKENNKELYDEIKNLKEHPLVVTKTKIEIVVDTIPMESDTIVDKNDTIKTLHWHSAEPNGYYNICGQTDVNNDFSDFTTTVNTLSIPVNMSLDIIEHDKQLKFIGRSDNPYVSITNMDGVIIDPKKSDIIKSYFKPKRWSVGPQVGIGVGRDLKFTPYIGVGITYGIFQW